MISAGWRIIFASLSAFGLILLVTVYYKFEESLLPSVTVSTGLRGILRQYGVLLRNRKFISYTLIAGLMQSALFAYVAGSPFIVIQLHGVSPEYFGSILCVNTFGLIIASQVNPYIVTKVGPAKMLGLVLWWPASLSVLLVLSLLFGYAQLSLLLVVLFGFLAGHGFISPNAAALALSDHGAQAGAASALMGTLQFLLGILTILFMGLSHPVSSMPLALVMAICSVAALLLHCFVARDLVH